MSPIFTPVDDTVLLADLTLLTHLTLPPRTTHPHCSLPPRRYPHPEYRAYADSLRAQVEDHRRNQIEMKLRDVSSPPSVCVLRNVTRNRERIET